MLNYFAGSFLLISTPNRTRSAAATFLARLLICLSSLMCAVVTSGCVKLIDDYDAKSVDAITHISTNAFTLFDRLIEATDQRPYSEYSADYGEVEVEMRAFVVQQAARPLNAESARIAQKMLAAWVRLRDFHKSRTNRNADLSIQFFSQQRDVFSRYCKAALVAEEAKQLAGESNH